MDINTLGDTPFDLMGDFNVHMGDSPIDGIPGNYPNVGKHGEILKEWLLASNVTMVNNHPSKTMGLWT